MQIFGQVWLWSLGSFLLGAFFTWLLLVRPMRKRLVELETSGQAYARPEPTLVAPPAPVGPTAADKSLDDLFDSQTKNTAQVLPPLPVAAPQVPRPAPAPEPIKGSLDVADEAVVGPTQYMSTTQSLSTRHDLDEVAPTQSIQSRLDPVGPPAPSPEPRQEESDTELADSSWRAFTESTTVFVPPADLKMPNATEPGGDDWFAREEDPNAITDVEDDEAVDETGTIFTQHTTPIPAEVIRSLDESQPLPAVPSGVEEETSAELTQAIMPPAPPSPSPSPSPSRHGLAPEEREPAYAEPKPSSAYESSLETTFDPPPSQEPAHALESPQESTRSLFEPVVPVAEHDDNEQGGFVAPGPFGPGSAMPLPGGGSPAPEFNVKASVTALRYCTQDNPQFDRIVAEVWFRSPSDAERVGFRVLS